MGYELNALGCANKVYEQVPPELTKDQVMEAKKIELQKFAERNIKEVADWSEAEPNPESAMLSAKCVITNKETVECPNARAANCQEPDLQGCHPVIVRKET